MAGKVFDDLLQQQIKVLKVASYVVVVCFSAIGFWLLKTLEHSFVYTVFIFVSLVLANALLVDVHKKAYLSYVILVAVAFCITVLFIINTGGITSHAIYVLITIPIGAFNTSRTQGKIWSGIGLLSILVLYFSDLFSIPVKNIIPEEYSHVFSLSIALYVLAFTAIFSYLIKNSSFNAYKSYVQASSELGEKRKRLENLVNLVNHSPHFMCVIDKESLTFDEINPFFKLELGYELVTVKGQKINAVFKQETLPDFLKGKTEDSEGNKHHVFENNIVCRNGTEKKFKFSAVVAKNKIYVNGREIH